MMYHLLVNSKGGKKLKEIIKFTSLKNYATNQMFHISLKVKWLRRKQFLQFWFLHRELRTTNMCHNKNFHET